MVLEYDPEFTITQPDFKKAKLQKENEGILSIVNHNTGIELMSFTED